MPESNPIPDAELVELRRQCGLTQADFAAVNRHLVLAAIARLEAAERERERLCEDRHFAVNMIRQMDPENLCDFFDDIGAEQELQRWLAERDSRQRRKGAKEAYEEARRITLTAGEKADIYDRLNERLVGLREGGE